ncbi:MAG: complex I subunit 5 family protein [Synergistales bacterium]|nr:complex I subunit 5 family protein [Synergistales bacterium]
MTDSISTTLTALAAIMTVPAALYGWNAARPRFYRVLPWLFLLFAWRAIAAPNWLVFVVFLELSSLTLFFFVLFKDRGTAFLYLYSQLAGGACLLLGTALAAKGGALPAVGPVPSGLFPLFVIGLGFKAALPGLHFWLPPTHSKAPAEASALLSGYAVKMGVYGLLRLVDGPSMVLMTSGVVMAALGAVQAPLQKDAKRLLAYSTLSQLGLIVTALATGTEQGKEAALLLVVAHALAKGLLFLTAGSLEEAYGTRDLDRLGRAALDFPLLFGLFLAGALSLAGTPFTAGGLAKKLVKATLAGYPATRTIHLAAGVGTTAALCKFAVYGYLRPFAPEAPRQSPRTIPCGQYLAMALFIGALAAAFLAASGTIGAEPATSGETALNFLALLGGPLLFGLLPRLFRPDRTTVDVENLLSPTGRFLAAPLSRLRRLHSGDLNFYLVLLLGAALIVLYLLRP